MLPRSLSAALTATEDVQHSACPIGCCNVVLTVTYLSVLLTLFHAPHYIRCWSVLQWHTSLSYWLSSTCLIRCCSVVLTVTYLSVLLTLFHMPDQVLQRCPHCDIPLCPTDSLPHAWSGVAALSSLWHTSLSTDSLPHASLGVAALSSLWHTSLSYGLSSACSRHQTQGHEINVDHYWEVFTE